MRLGDGLRVAFGSTKPISTRVFENGSSRVRRGVIVFQIWVEIRTEFMLLGGCLLSISSWQRTKLLTTRGSEVEGRSGDGGGRCHQADLEVVMSTRSGRVGKKEYAMATRWVRSGVGVIRGGW